MKWYNWASYKLSVFQYSIVDDDLGNYVKTTWDNVEIIDPYKIRT
jgi:hypothetical protein